VGEKYLSEGYRYSTIFLHPRLAQHRLRRPDLWQRRKVYHSRSSRPYPQLERRPPANSYSFSYIGGRDVVWQDSDGGEDWSSDSSAGSGDERGSSLQGSAPTARIAGFFGEDGHGDYDSQRRVSGDLEANAEVGEESMYFSEDGHHPALVDQGQLDKWFAEISLGGDYNSEDSPGVRD